MHTYVYASCSLLSFGAAVWVERAASECFSLISVACPISTSTATSAADATIHTHTYSEGQDNRL